MSAVTLVLVKLEGVRSADPPIVVVTMPLMTSRASSDALRVAMAAFSLCVLALVQLLRIPVLSKEERSAGGRPMAVIMRQAGGRRMVLRPVNTLGSTSVFIR